MDDDVKKILKAKFIHHSDEDYTKYVLHVLAEYEAALNDLPAELYTTEANGRIPDNCKYPLAAIQAAQNQKQIDT